MPRTNHQNRASQGWRPRDDPAKWPTFQHVLACVDDTQAAAHVLAHGAAIAGALGSRLTALRAIEAGIDRAALADPVGWDLACCDAKADLERLVADAGLRQKPGVAIIEGPVATGIGTWSQKHAVDLTVLGSHGASRREDVQLGSAVRPITEALPGSFVIVPIQDRAPASGGDLRYDRIIVPLDGSSQAEAALAITMQIAKAHESKVLLIHVAPDVALTEIAPPEAKDIALRDQLRRRNERVAAQYLQRIKGRLAAAGLQVRILVLESSEPRHALARTVEDEKADLVVLSTAGVGSHADLPIGSTADYLMSHAAVPVLLVRSDDAAWHQPRHTTEAAPKSRLPGQTLP